MTVRALRSSTASPRPAVANPRAPSGAAATARTAPGTVRVPTDWLDCDVDQRDLRGAGGDEDDARLGDGGENEPA